MVLFFSEQITNFVSMETIKLIAEQIKIERKKRGLSQEGLAMKSEVGRAYMSTVENGYRNISLHMLCQIITKGLNMTMSDFFIEFDKRNSTNH